MSRTEAAKNSQKIVRTRVINMLSPFGMVKSMKSLNQYIESQLSMENTTILSKTGIIKNRRKSGFKINPNPSSKHLGPISMVAIAFNPYFL